MSGAASSGQAATWAARAISATTGPLLASVVATLTFCISIRVELSPRPQDPTKADTPDSLSAVSPSATRHKSDIYNIVFVFLGLILLFGFYVEKYKLCDIQIRKILFGTTGPVYTLYVFCECAPYMVHCAKCGAFFHRKMPILRQI